MEAGSATRGTRLIAGRYRLLDAVGSGGMGTVWRARDERLGRLVAVKEVRPPAGMTEAEYADLRERTLREARAAARLSTPGAVAVHDVVESDGRPYVVMELLRGRSLAQVVVEDGPLTPAEAARVGLSLLATLTAAHAAGILHRDVKPANVVLDDGAAGAGGGRVVLTDFGIAKTAGDPQLTSTGVLLGSPAYIPPERARGREAGPSSDLYSLGATLFTAVEGQPPFRGADAMATLLAVVSGERQPMVAAGPLAPALEALLEPDPRRRPAPEEAERLLLAAVRPPTSTAPRTAPTVALSRPGAAPERGRDDERTLVVPVPLRSDDPPGPPPGPRPVPPSTAPAGRPAGTGRPPGTDRPTGTDRPAGAGVPASPRRRSRAPLLAVLAVLAVLALGGAALLAGRAGDPASPSPDASTGGTTAGAADGADAAASTDPDDSPTDGTAPPEAPAPSPQSPAPEPEPEPEPEAEPAAAGGVAAPEGWATYTDDDGWSLAHPPGWRAESRDVRGEQLVQITSPDGGGRYIRVSDDGTAGGDPVQRWREFAEQFAARTPSYSEEGIEAVEDYRYTPAADWEFTYSAGGDELRVLDRMFFTDDGRAYAVLVQGPRDDDVGEVFEGVVESFRVPEG